MAAINKLIALDDGHGDNTAGKRTPVMPDGSVIRENQFNRAVKRLTAVELQRCGFRTMFTAPELEDVPLATRTKRANDAKADVFVSIHFNAFDGVFDTNKGGVETHHYPGSISGQKLATAIQKYLKQGTPLIDRGVKASNFHVLRETTMPAALVEAGFMDVRQEAALMLDPAYQLETAQEITKGICEYFGVPYVADTTAPKETAAVTYTVAAGDTLSKIAAAFNTTVDALAKLNGISNPNVIRVGQVLKIKEAVAAPTPEPVKPQPVTGTPIIGPATATVAQAQEWARQNRAPQAFIDLAPLVWSVAQKAYIDPAVVWVQFAHETGFLYRDGKSMAGIDASYFNPCGLKVTEGGGDTVASAHKRFKDWEEGFTAQVDHLALYAGAPGYPKAGTPDPRHFPYLKGTAPTVESLGGKWAPSATYGNHLATWLKAVQAIKVAEPVTPPAASDDVKRLQERVAQLEKELEQANGRAVVAERAAAEEKARYEKYEKVFKDIKTLMGGI